ncbi:hypothetical protein PR003_g28515 [Phytophthora rubi]|uniref:Uncharacterized protein n=1 Tax=Phytophthora rubi TaxID=129364 RepID=A0A6A3HIZ9_9STRA|nr:hypothetical protein PR002_g27474 [Phytophthora rubi]KAE8970004.1 hypothetical protein PR001_g27337 [Phytophthora rubi]KAE9278470.1 hypothetical protein PR003_g28515 [Phytophthora rubi]
MNVALGLTCINISISLLLTIADYVVLGYSESTSTTADQCWQRTAHTFFRTYCNYASSYVFSAPNERSLERHTVPNASKGVHQQPE